MMSSEYVAQDKDISIVERLHPNRHLIESYIPENLAA